MKTILKWTLLGLMLPTVLDHHCPVISAERLTAATHYVARDGDDANPGTEAKPWLTISKAASVAVAGDTVLVKAGTYEGKVRFANGGTEQACITYKPYKDDEVTIFDPAREDHVVLFTKPYIVF